MISHNVVISNVSDISPTISSNSPCDTVLNRRSDERTHRHTNTPQLYLKHYLNIRVKQSQATAEFVCLFYSCYVVVYTSTNIRVQFRFGNNIQEPLPKTFVFFWRKPTNRGLRPSLPFSNRWGLNYEIAHIARDSFSDVECLINVSD